MRWRERARGFVQEGAHPHLVSMYLWKWLDTLYPNLVPHAQVGPTWLEREEVHLILLSEMCKVCMCVHVHTRVTSEPPVQKGEPSAPARALTGVPTHTWLGCGARGTLVVQRGILSGGNEALDGPL